MYALKDNIICLIAFLVFSYAACCAQDASKYSFQKAEKVLHEEFFKGAFWTMPTDENDVCYFQTKSEAKETARIKPIPVLRLTNNSKPLSFEPDYLTYAAFLFKQNSFLCPLYVSAYRNNSGALKQYMTVGWSPSPDFVKHYLDNSSSWFYLESIKDFVFTKGSRYYVWDDAKSSLEDYTERLIAFTREINDQKGAGQKFTGIDSLGVERVREYRISTVPLNFHTVQVFQSKEDTVQIGLIIEVAKAKDGVNSIVVKTTTENYFIELHPKKEWISITTDDHAPFVTCVNAPYTTTSQNELGFKKFKGYSKRLVEANVKKNLKKGTVEFIPVKSKQPLLVGQRIKNEKGDYFIIHERVQNVVNPKILRLAAIVIFWSDAFIEVQGSVK